MVKGHSATSVNKLIEYRSSCYRLKMSVAMFKFLESRMYCKNGRRLKGVQVQP